MKLPSYEEYRKSEIRARVIKIIQYYPKMMDVEPTSRNICEVLPRMDAIDLLEVLEALCQEGVIVKIGKHYKAVGE